MPDYQKTSAAFTYIYDHKVWGEGSGASSPAVTQPYMQMLTDFLRNNGVKSVVDVGCGDWQFSHALDWTGIRYYGFDVVERVIKANEEKFGSDTVTFHIVRHISELPKADLILCKDLLQHLPLRDIQEYLDYFLSNYKFAIVTNDIYPPLHLNEEINLGECRSLRLDLPPFKLKVASLLQWTITAPQHHWIKSSCLLVSRPSQAMADTSLVGRMRRAFLRREI